MSSNYLKSILLILLHLQTFFFILLQMFQIFPIYFILLILFFQSSLCIQQYFFCIHFHFRRFFVLIVFTISFSHYHHLILDFYTIKFFFSNPKSLYLRFHFLLIIRLHILINWSFFPLLLWNYLQAHQYFDCLWLLIFFWMNLNILIIYFQVLCMTLFLC